MEIEEIGRSTKKLGKNKVFLIAFIGVIIFAFITIVKKENGGNSEESATMVAIGDYPDVGENTSTVIDSVNSESTINTQHILDAIGDLQGSMVMDNSDLKTEITDSLQTVLETFNSHTIYTNDFIMDGFSVMNEKINVFENNMSDSFSDLSMNISDKLDSGFSNVNDNIFNSQQAQIDKMNQLEDTMRVQSSGIRDEIAFQENRNQQALDRQNEMLNDRLNNLSDRQALLAQNINDNYDTLRNMLKR